ncbi:MAG: LysE family translocator [Bacteroidales bacterium]|jgi:threonine/homoserine/homoserine lactone efflux protein|nr:LysE family translocator [Bacteroidales bacterium]
MLHVIIQGVSVGFGLAFLVGPSFFSLFQTSLEKGFLAAFRFAFGVVLSDLFLVAVAFLGISRLFEYPAAKVIVTIAGSGVLISYGIFMLIKKADLQSKKTNTHNNKNKTSWAHTLRGFTTNLANPGTWFFWIFWVGIISAQYSTGNEVQYLYIILFFVIALGINFICDMLKAYGAHKLQRFITVKNISIANKVVGILLIGFGAYLMLDLYFDFGLLSEATAIPTIDTTQALTNHQFSPTTNIN